MNKYELRMIAYLLLLTTMNAFTASQGIEDVIVHVSPTQVAIEQGFIYYDQVSYVRGGITITYPPLFFTNSPAVLATIVLSGRAYSANEFFTAEVVSSTATSATIRVNIATALPIPRVVEANSGDVIVHFRAMGQ